MGIDPGTTVMGYGLIEIVGAEIKLLQYGVIHLSKYKDHYLKLKKIYERVSQLIQDFTPDEMALEAPFFGKNVQSILKLGRAQGVAMAAVLIKDLPISEYSPRKIKKSITGNGASSKEQVAAMLKSILKLNEIPKSLDATDGMATAVCHYFQKNIINQKKPIQIF